MLNSERFLEDCFISTNEVQRDAISLLERYVINALFEYLKAIKGDSISVQLDKDPRTALMEFSRKMTLPIRIGNEQGEIEIRNNTVRLSDSNNNLFVANLSARPSGENGYAGNIILQSFIVNKEQGNESLSAQYSSAPIIYNNESVKI